MINVKDEYGGHVMDPKEVQKYFDNYGGKGKSYFDNSWQAHCMTPKEVLEAYYAVYGNPEPKLVLDLGAANGAWLNEFKKQWWDPLESTCRHASLSIL